MCKLVDKHLKVGETIAFIMIAQQSQWVTESENVYMMCRSEFPSNHASVSFIIAAVHKYLNFQQAHPAGWMLKWSSTLSSSVKENRSVALCPQFSHSASNPAGEEILGWRPGTDPGDGAEYFNRLLLFWLELELIFSFVVDTGYCYSGILPTGLVDLLSFSLQF